MLYELDVIIAEAKIERGLSILLIKAGHAGGPDKIFSLLQSPRQLIHN